MDQDVFGEIARSCMLLRTRLVSRVVTNLYEEKLRPFGVNAPQLALLTLVFHMGRPTRAELGRALRQDRSTLTRNLVIILSSGWAEEVRSGAGGRARPLMLTRAGENLVRVGQLDEFGADTRADVIDRIGAATLDVVATALEAEAVGDLSDHAPQHRLLAGAEAFLRANLHDAGLDLETIAEALHTSPRTLNRAFAR